MTDILELIIPRKLQSPNKTRGYHWRTRHRETKVWEALVRIAGLQADVASWSLILSTETRQGPTGRWYIVEERKHERRRVTIVRQVPNSCHFIADDDNLRFAAKPINDALKRLGLVYDDRRTWMEQPMPIQEVSPDKTARTIVRIERLLGATLGA